jgi:hypothetical protein
MVSFGLMVSGIIVGAILLAVSSGTYNEVAGTEDFTQYSWDEYNGYVLFMDTGDLSTIVVINVDSEMDFELDILVEVYIGDDLIGSHRRMTPVSKDFSIGLTNGEVEVYIDIQDTNYTIEDLSVSVETNNSYVTLCSGGIIAILFFLIFLPLGIIFLVMAFRKGGKSKKDQTYSNEIEDLKKKIQKMEKMGLDTSEEKKLMENYRKGLQ